MQETVTLYFRQGNSDKVYHASIEEKDGGHVVNFAFGRRGSTLQTGTKTASPVDSKTAKAIFDKLIQEKTGKGYTPGTDGTPYMTTVNEQRATGLVPQLLNPVEEAETERLIEDPAFWMQEKFDGKRVLLRKCEDGSVTGINRKGLTIGMPEPILAHARALAGTFVVDGEAVGEKLFVFDCILLNGADLASKPYSHRLKTLTNLIVSGSIDCVPTATTPVEKRALLERLKRERKEGAVFKRHDSAYSPGRPASGGNQLKLKFYATATCLVSKVNAGKRSVSLEVLDAKNERMGIGNVTISAGTNIPAPGALVEIKYLYAYKGGSLYQPIYLGIRDDLKANACTLSQLKYRASSEEDDEG